jgi:hypothetical protein
MGAEVQGQFGGNITFTFGNQTFVIADAEIKLSPATFEVSSKANQDGSAAYELKPELVGAEIEFRNVGDVNWAAITQLVGNATIVEQTNGRTHLFTGTRLIGKPDVNLSTGAVAGLKISGGTYQFLGSS